MRDFILFVDTETTGIPQDWHAPYADDTSWPHSIQIAWQVYTKDGTLVTAQNHYIYHQNVSISEESTRIHGLTLAFLRQHGTNRRAVLMRLLADLAQYQPLVAGHFMQLDYHMLGVGFYRENLPNPLLGYPLFCTMQATAGFLLPPGKKFLRLGELYQRLFRKPLVGQHNAEVDASATAACFFKLLQQGDITEKSIARQQPVKTGNHTSKRKFILSAIAAFRALPTL